MLKPALLYKEEIERKEIESWNDPTKMWWHSGPYRYTIDLCSGTDKGYGVYEHACVNSNDEVIGFFSYFIDWQVKSVSQFGLVSYIDGFNIILVKDVLEDINGLFRNKGIQRMQWNCYADNPFIKGYRKAISLYGGHEVGIYHRCGLLEDGKIHDSVIFEILKEEWHYEHR